MGTATTELLDAIRVYSCKLDATMLADQARVLNEKDENSYLGLALLTMLSSQMPDLYALLGERFKQGNGVRCNQDKALALYQQATASGSTSGEYALGWHFYEQDNYLSAIEHFENSIHASTALAGDELMQAHACIGDAYSKLNEPNYRKAIEHLTVAANKYHSIFANRRLGFIYCDTTSHQYDIQKSIRYLGFAADNGDVISAHQLATIYIFGDAQKEVGINGRLAESVLIPFMNCDDADIMYDVGMLYFLGDEKNGMNKDYDKARFYFEKAWKSCKTGIVAAELGYLYFLNKDYEKAAEMLIYADNSDCSNYSDFLGTIYLNGYLGTPDKTKAAHFFERAYNSNSINNFFTCMDYLQVLYDLFKYSKAYDIAEYGIKQFNDIGFYYQKARLVLQGKVCTISPEDAASIMDDVRDYDGYQEEACFELGQYYQNANRFTRAIQYYTMAFDMGKADAGVCIARIYEHGGGSIQKSSSEANRWYTKAANAGSKFRR